MLHGARVEHALAAPTLTAWARALKQRRFTLADAFLVAMILYVLVVTVMRFFYAFWPWTMEGDWKQWIWQYHRYFTDGAFPPGHVITDYQFRVQPPFYWLAMSGLTHVVHPGVAARILAVVAWALTLTGMYRATTKLSHWVIGLAAVVFLSHDVHVFVTTTGGYPRSFGIALVLLCLDAWLARRHFVVLAILVTMAGLYPSVLPPCGLAYGVATTLLALREGRRTFAIKLGTLVVAAALCAAIGLSQNLLALDWWGPVISYAEAEHLAALQVGGRMHWVPHGGYVQNIGEWFTQPWVTAGALAHYGLTPWPFWLPRAAGAIVTVALTVLVVMRRHGSTQGAQGAPPALRVPWEPIALLVAALLSYVAARELAFRLYLPMRVLQHTAPVVLIVLVSALSYQAARALPRMRAKVLPAALAFTLLPVFVMGGDGFLLPAWGDYSHRKEQMSWIRDNTPVTAQFAGDIATCDLIPYFAARTVYVNWTMAHPFRLGYWAEIERRLRRDHDVMYATTREPVLRFIEEEHIDYLVLDRERFTEPDSGRKLFYPLRDDVLLMFAERKRAGFVLAAPPPSSIVWQDGNYVVIDVKTLREAWLSAMDVTP